MIFSHWYFCHTLEMSPQDTCSYLEFLGITLDELKNREQSEAVRISEGTSKVNVLVIRTNEELEIAREAAEVARQNGVK